MNNRFSSLGQRALRLAVFAVAVCIVGFESQAFEPTSGDAVEVREGDIWSPAEFLKKEGRRHQIRYDDGTEEWVTADRLRAVGGAGSSASEPVRDKPRRFRQGQEVELKKFSRWVAAEIKRASPPLYLVATKEGIGEKEFHWEWVDADRLREEGEDHQGPDTRSQFGHRVGNDSIKDSLREAKKAYADDQLKESQAARDENGKRDPFGAPPFAHPVTEADRSTMQTMRVTPGGWERVLVDPADESATRDVAIKLRAGTNAPSEKPVALSISGVFGLVVIEEDSPRTAKKLYAEKVDLAKGRSLGVVEFDAASRPIAISGDGQRVAAVANGFHGGSMQRLDVWDWSGRQPRHVVSFVPFDAGQGTWADVNEAVFATPDTLIVKSRGGEVSAWDATTGRGLWEAQGLGRGSMAWALSPGGEFVAVVAQDHVVLLDAQTGDARASLPGAGFAVRSLGFSPDGQTLAAAGTERIKGWDLKNREAWPSIGLRPGSRGEVAVFDAKTAVAGGWVYDLTTGQPLWGLEFKSTPRETNSLQAGHLVTVDKNNRQRRGSGPAFTLNNWSLPGAAQQPIAQARRDGSPAMLLSRGDRVTIDLSKLDATAQEREAIRAALVAQLEVRGVEVAEGQPIRLVGVTTSESQQQVYESTTGSAFNREQTQVNVETKTTRLAVEADGQPAWAWVTVTSPSTFVRIEEGQSMQQAVNASARGDVSGLLSRLSLPDLMPDPRRGPTGGTVLAPDDAR